MVSRSIDKMGCSWHGCNTVKKTKDLVSVDDGSTGWQITKKCRGVGISICDVFSSVDDGEGDIDPYDINVFATMDMFIADQIAQSINVGSVIQTFIDPSGNVRSYQITWSKTTNALGEEEFHSDINLL